MPTHTNGAPAGAACAEGAEETEAQKVSAAGENEHAAKMAEGEEAENLRSEYTAIVEYGTSLVNSRFTIAGLYVAAAGFLASAFFDKDVEAMWRPFIAGFAFWLTLCLWILELRSRCLAAHLGHRGMEIEHTRWQMRGKRWYSGFHSRQYNEAPAEGSPDAVDVLAKPQPEQPRVLWFKRPLSSCVSAKITHTAGLDLLYVGSAVLWIALAFTAACHGAAR